MAPGVFPEPINNLSNKSGKAHAVCKLLMYLLFLLAKLLVVSLMNSMVASNGNFAINNFPIKPVTSIILNYYQRIYQIYKPF